MSADATGGRHEHNANAVIAQWLNDAGRDCTAAADRTGVIAGSNARPDIVIRQGDRMPVIVECEFRRPAVSDAVSRLGIALRDNPRQFTEIVAVGIAAECERDSEARFRRRLDADEPALSFQLVSQCGAEVKVWPDRPLPGTASDLAAYCEYAQVPQAVIDAHSRWTSQATAAAQTPDAAHGAAAWTALCGISSDNGKAVALFYNSIFGGIVKNAYGAIQKQGRSEVRIGATAALPCFAFNADTAAAQRARDLAAREFDGLARLELEPFAYCFRDRNRHRIDDAVAAMLGLDPTDAVIQSMLAHYRRLFAREPNVNGRQQPILAALAQYEAGN